MNRENASFKERLIEHNIKINIANGIFATIAMNLVNPYFAKLAERLGATDYQIAYLTSLPHFVSIFAFIPGAILIENSRDKKKATGSMIFLHKLFFLLLAFVPFLKKFNRASLFVLLVGLMNLPGSIGTMGFQSSIGDIFLPEDRGRAMGLRNRYATIFGMITTFISGELLTRIPNTNEEAIRLYQIFFITAFVIAQGEVISYFKFKGMRKTNKDKPNSKYIDCLKTTLKDIPRQRDFLLFSLCSFSFHVGWVMAQPLFNIYTIKNLGANEVWLSIISIASSLSSTLAYTKWANFADKKGNDFALSFAILGMSITPILYAFSESIKMLVLFNIIIGISVAGTVLILFNILLQVTPRENRTVYIAVYNTFIAIISAISPVVGIAIKDRIGIKRALILIGILRFISTIFFFIRSKSIKNKSNNAEENI